MLRVRQYSVTKTPDDLFRTWVAAAGRFVSAYTFEDLLIGLRFVELGLNPTGHGIEVHVEYRHPIKQFEEKPPYAVLGGPVEDKLQVHDRIVGIDAVADTLLGLERQLWYQAHDRQVVCPAGFGRLDLVYREAFTLDGSPPTALGYRTTWRSEFRMPSWLVPKTGPLRQ